MPAVRVNSRSVLVTPDAVTASAAAGGLGLYARVSSHDQKPDLDRQVGRLAAWAAQSGQAVARVEAEVGSGMNGARSKVRRLLADPRVRTVVVEHRDRLGRMNTELVEAAFRRRAPPGGARPGRGRRRPGSGHDGGPDVFCARLYGRRSARNRAEKALRCAARDIGPSSPEAAG